MNVEVYRLTTGVPKRSYPTEWRFMSQPALQARVPIIINRMFSTCCTRAFDEVLTLMQ